MAPARGAAMLPRHDVFEHAHLPEQPHVLERAGDAGARHLTGLQRQRLGAVEDDAAALRLVEAGDAVEERGLAGAVRADEAGDGAGVDREVHVLQHAVAGKAEA